MAKKVTITWVDPSPTTNVDHLEIWRKTGVGGTYAQIGTDISLAAANSYEDTNGGAGLTDGETYYYQVRAYAADGTTYEEVEGNITISAVTIYGLSFDAAEAAYAPYTPGAANFTIEATIDTIRHNGDASFGSMLFGTSSRNTAVTNGALNVRVDDDGVGGYKVVLKLRDSALEKITSFYPLVNSDTVKVIRTETAMTLYINNVLKESITINAEWIWAGTNINLCDFDETPTNTLEADISSFIVDGNVLLPTTQSSGTPITTGTPNLGLVSSGSVDAMYYAI